MNKSVAFFACRKEVNQLRALRELRRHVLIVGAAGIGKTVLLQHVQQLSPMLICDDSSSLRRICGNLERQLGWAHYKLNLIERKNRLFAGLERRGQPVAFDNVNARCAACGAIDGACCRENSDLDRLPLG